MTEPDLPAAERRAIVRDSLGVGLATGVYGVSFGAVAAVLTALLLGTRNTLYGLRLAPLLDWHGWRRALGAHVLIDESTAMSVTRTSTAAARVGFLTTGVSIFVLWNAATLVGALVGLTLGDPRTYGLDAAVGGTRSAPGAGRPRGRPRRCGRAAAPARAVPRRRLRGGPGRCARPPALNGHGAGRGPDQRARLRGGRGTPRARP